MTHHLSLNLPWEDPHAPVLWPKIVGVKECEYGKGDDIVVVIGSKGHPARVIEARGQGDSYEIILDRA